MSTTTPQTMKSVLVSIQPTLHTTIEEIPLPTPGKGQVLIRVIAAGSNPKDHEHLKPSTPPLNSGDDVAGYVAALGADVEREGGLREGDRVAGFHPMMQPHGAYAEYAIVPARTVFKIPEGMGFEEAATIPLVLTTAAITLFRRQHLPSPFPTTPTPPPTPLIIYGASSSLGTFIIKLARASNIHPLIAIAGSSSTHLAPLLDTSKGDVLIDYRAGIPSTKAAVAAALKGLPCHHAIDAITSSKANPPTWVPLSQMLTPSTPSQKTYLSVVSGANKYDEADIPDGVNVVYTYVGTAHSGAYIPTMPKQPPAEEQKADLEWVDRLYEYVPKMLANQTLTGHPYTVVDGGLEGVEKGLLDLKAGKAKGVKFVYRVAAE